MTTNAADDIHTAAQLYHADLYADGDWAAATRGALRGQLTTALRALSDAWLPDRPDLAGGELERLLTIDPLTDTVWHQLIRLHHQGGQPDRIRTALKVTDARYRLAGLPPDPHNLPLARQLLAESRPPSGQTDGRNTNPRGHLITPAPSEGGFGVRIGPAADYADTGEVAARERSDGTQDQGVRNLPRQQNHHPPAADHRPARARPRRIARLDASRPFLLPCPACQGTRPAAPLTAASAATAEPADDGPTGCVLSEASSGWPRERARRHSCRAARRRHGHVRPWPASTPGCTRPAGRC